MTEILIAFIGKVSLFFFILAVLLGVTNVLVFLICMEDFFGPTAERQEKENKRIIRFFKASVPVFFLFFIIGNFPSIDDVWKVRIAMIKLQLASPENLSKATDTIERIGQKLECKYLGCDEEKEKSP